MRNLQYCSFIEFESCYITYNLFILNTESTKGMDLLLVLKRMTLKEVGIDMTQIIK